ncbi:MAG: hypothetical protein BGO10_03725 [Chlamydia sp. 32-24]|nr:MAG: hypothetical protein BGO10_03725 [Chlamydia sp. 32-24]
MVNNFSAPPPTPPTDWNTHNLQYKEMIKRLENVSEIEQKVEIITKENLEEIKLLIDQFNAHDFSHPIFSSPETPLLALAAYKANLIADTQIATLLMILAENRVKKEDSEFTFVPLFIDDSINPEAMRLVELKSGNEIYNMTDEKVKLLFEKMKDLPPSEQGIYIHKSAHHPKESIKNDFQRLLFQPLSIGAKSSEKVIPTVGLFQTFLNTQYGENAVQLSPVIALSSFRDIETKAIGKIRDLGLDLIGKETPPVADGYLMEGSDVTVHDMFHAAAVSAGPVEIRKLNVLLVDRLKQLENKFKGMQLTAFNQIIAALVDFEYTNAKPGFSDIENYVRFIFEVLRTYSTVNSDYGQMRDGRFVREMEKEIKKVILNEDIQAEFSYDLTEDRVEELEDLV